MTAALNLLGQKFGQLIVVSRSPQRGGFSRWVCRCGCGVENTVTSRNLKTGNTRSCGCLRTRHGHALSRNLTTEYRAWSAMIQRCTNPNATGYENYGGRGIAVCRRWFKFDNFLADMGLKPSPKLTLERVKNNRGYSPKNCIWDTRSNQNRNRRPRKSLRAMDGSR